MEINSHSLFSKWFSESGKLVGRMFEEIMQMLADEDIFVVVLIGLSCRDVELMGMLSSDMRL